MEKNKISNFFVQELFQRLLIDCNISKNYEMNNKLWYQLINKNHICHTPTQHVPFNFVLITF